MLFYTRNAFLFPYFFIVLSSLLPLEFCRNFLLLVSVHFCMEWSLCALIVIARKQYCLDLVLGGKPSVTCTCKFRPYDIQLIR